MKSMLVVLLILDQQGNRFRKVDNCFLLNPSIIIYKYCIYYLATLHGLFFNRGPVTIDLRA